VERRATQPVATTTTQSSEEVNMEPGESLIQRERNRIAHDTENSNRPYTLELLDIVPPEIHGEIFQKLDLQSLL
jgi:hypothetical protein